MQVARAKRVDLSVRRVLVSRVDTVHRTIGAPISNSIVRELSGLWTVMLHPFGILSVGGFHAATRSMRDWVWAFLTFPYLYILLDELVKF